MKSTFFFFIATIIISSAPAQTIPHINPNVTVAGKNTAALISIPSVTIVNEPGSPLYSQIWMQKNLSVTTYRNGDPIPEVKDPVKWSKLTTGAWCYYENNVNYGKVYGILYNWYAVNDPRGLAPAGWHIPSDTEWTTLSNALGGDDVAGGKMKEMGTTNWHASNDGATNYSGFTGLPGSCRYFTGDFGVTGWYVVGEGGFWWSSTQRSAAYAWPRLLIYNLILFDRKDQPKQCGFSVRCIKD